MGSLEVMRERESAAAAFPAFDAREMVRFGDAAERGYAAASTEGW